jgi:ribulose 1,5-bisphosphate carboxylase large subunit-like protein
VLPPKYCRSRKSNRRIAPSLASAWLERKKIGGPWRRAIVRIAFPVANIGANLPTLAATVSGNLYDLGEVTGLRLNTSLCRKPTATGSTSPPWAWRERACATAC